MGTLMTESMCWRKSTSSLNDCFIHPIYNAFPFLCINYHDDDQHDLIRNKECSNPSLVNFYVMNNENTVIFISIAISSSFEWSIRKLLYLCSFFLLQKKLLFYTYSYIVKYFLIEFSFLTKWTSLLTLGVKTSKSNMA